MKKILFIHHGIGWGGAPNSLIKLINGLDTSKYEAEVLLLKDSIVSKKLKENHIKFRVADSIFYKKIYEYFPHNYVSKHVKWYQLYLPLKLSILWLLSHYYFAKKELLKHEFDIVHLNSSVLTDWLYPAKNKGKVIIHIREPLRKGKLDILYYFFTSQMRRYADHIIAISNDNAQRVNVPSKTTVVYNYSNVENIDELNIKEYSSKSVLYVGGLAEIKGFYNMVEALPFINDDIKVYFAGYYNTSLSNDHSNVTLKIKLKRILKKILFRKETMLYNNFVRSSKAINIGLLSDINEYLDQTVCLISPFSLPHFARPIIESYARRKPAIATKIDGMDELIDHDKTGFLVELGNPQSLANNINLLCENPKVAKEMGNNGYLKAKSNFSQNNNNQILDVFDNLFN